jgi:hypothetical protein
MTRNTLKAKLDRYDIPLSNGKTNGKTNGK